MVISGVYIKICIINTLISVHYIKVLIIHKKSKKTEG